MGEQFVLEFVWRDVLALADDQILCPASDHDAPIRTEVSAVTATEPPVCGERVLPLLVVGVTRGQVAAAQFELAVGTYPHLGSRDLPSRTDHPLVDDVGDIAD